MMVKITEKINFWKLIKAKAVLAFLFWRITVNDDDIELVGNLSLWGDWAKDAPPTI
jgi:hypothetical protein